MASPTVPTHGKIGALYALRPNGYVNVSTGTVGLNDATWGLAYNAAATAYFTCTVDGELTGAGGEDEFTWTINGGGGAAGVEMNAGVPIALGADNQTITWAAETGHTLGDKWELCNFHDEPTTIVASTSQVTNATRRIINPNDPPTWTPTAGVALLHVNNTNGMATWSGAPGVTTVHDNNGYILPTTIQKVGYLIGWNLNVALDMGDISSQGDHWKEAIPGMAGATGSAEAYFIEGETWFRNLEDQLSATGEQYFLLKLFTYDPDGDYTGDHYICWVSFNSWDLNPTIGEVVKETVNFQITGDISFTANV